MAKVTTGGSFTEYVIPTASSSPFSIAADRSGNLWVVEFFRYGTTQGPDGKLWLTELFGNQIGPHALRPAAPSAAGRWRCSR